MNLETTVRYPRRQSRAIAGGLAWTLAFPILFTAIGKLVGTLLHLPNHGPPSWLGWALLGGIGAGLAVAGALHQRGAARRGSVRREGDRVLIERAGVTREIPVSDVDSGWISREPKCDRLGLALVGGESITVDLPSGDGQAKLEELGLDVTKKRLNLSLWSGFESGLQTFAGGVLGWLDWIPLAGIGTSILKPLGAGSAIGTILGFATVLPMMVAGAIAMRRRRQAVSIGADGISVTGGSFSAKPRYYPLDRVVGVAHKVTVTHKGGGAGEYGLELKLRGATAGAADETVTIARLVAMKGDPPPVLLTLEERIREAIAARDAAVPAEASALLDVPGAGVGTWLEALKKLASTGDGYRAATLTKERLLELVDDARAKLSHRIGAAIVLAERGDEDGLARVRVAADTSVSPRVRVALDAVARRTIDEQAIAEAIADDEAAEPDQRSAAAPSR